MPADDDTAAALGISPGSPVLITRTRHYAADGKLIEYAETTMPAGRRYGRSYSHHRQLTAATHLLRVRSL